MREIRFRAWDGKEMHYIDETCPLRFEEKGRWFVMTQGDELICNFLNGQLMQYTGLRDSKYRKIYEGDVIKLREDAVCEVLWCNGAFKLMETASLGRDGWLHELQEICACTSSQRTNAEVIGNVWENPELLNP